MKSLHHLFITDELADVSNQPSLGRGQGTHSSSLIAAGGTGHEVARLTFRLVTLLVSIKERVLLVPVVAAEIVIHLLQPGAATVLSSDGVPGLASEAQSIHETARSQGFEVVMDA